MKFHDMIAVELRKGIGSDLTNIHIQRESKMDGGKQEVVELTFDD